ncbi:uncharacterized protein LOC133883901 [Phragmites australis]|uniref:uncharacterized protein LOC133883901 n=1 Tax=Phragmites australis TaxID=29695 RepID=UPI002D7683F9|nr:uncharacterized protein LOC133883901 [Phragmites australis]XP_062179282.1 uncharacterized protein LOC133883901 [Phragmites australis]XP_062179283.1 uncharacterized protein LOC133883901 [Phragmites australis]XP_062179284.1 uncharacterized protein LOC133883901 [Phragmites australis]
MDLILPYKIGDFAEAKSFLTGYRGAWFRCKVDNMRVTKSGHLECYLEYIDYPGEKKEWTELFQKNPACSKQKSSESSQIMIRPSFPQWYWRDQVPGQFPNSDVIATVYETWKVGDLVDWLSEGCYWSGTITKLLNEDTVKVELLAPPIGEGKRYTADRNDLRPTLDWSLAKGWTVPLSKANGKSWNVARLFHHRSESGEETASDDEDEEGGGGGGGKDVPQSVIRGSNMSQEAPGSFVTKPPSATNSNSSLNAQKDAILAFMEDSKPSSTSKAPDPNHAAQAAATSCQPGTGSSVKEEPGIKSSIKQEQDSSPTEHEAHDVSDEYLKRLEQVEDKLKHLERTRSEGQMGRAC